MIALEPRPAPSKLMAALSPLIAIALTLGFGALLFAILGKPPLEALRVYFLSPFDDAYMRAEVLVKAIPLALMGAGLAVCFRANVWNIGAAGQYTLGAIGAGAAALFIPASSPFAMLITPLLAGMLFGAAWAAIPAALRTRLGVNEILVSLMLTYVAALLLDWLVRGPWRNPRGFGFPQSNAFPDWAQAPILVEGTRLHLGAIVAVVAAIGLGLMMARALRGLRLRVTGSAPRAARFAGFSSAGDVWFVMLLSGALAGLAGAFEAVSTVGRLQPDIGASAGFTAIIVAFLGRLNPAGALLGALVLAVSAIGGENAQILMQLPKNVAGVFQGMLLFFLLACDSLINYRPRWIARRAA